VRAVVQRVRQASVGVDGDVVAEIGPGVVVLLGVARGDTAADADRLAGKIARLRIFENDEGRFDRSLLDVVGEALVVSQFTLIADTRKGNRPSFTDAADPELAEPLYDHLCAFLEEAGVRVSRGVFGARMQVSLVNDGPVTIVLDT
jgi:D-aminoacyl-tRNA deacylase